MLMRVPLDCALSHTRMPGAAYFGLGRANFGCTACKRPARISATVCATARATLRASYCIVGSPSSVSWLVA